MKTFVFPGILARVSMELLVPVGAQTSIHHYRHHHQHIILVPIVINNKTNITEQG
jgi:hypothetical protein